MISRSGGTIAGSGNHFEYPPSGLRYADRMPDHSQSDQPSMAWRGDVVLEIWVETRHIPVDIRLAGVLDETTAGNLLSVVSELIADGIRDFAFQTSGLSVPDSPNNGVIVDLQRILQRSGSRFTWDGFFVTQSLESRFRAVASQH